MSEDRIKIMSVKGRPMLQWLGKTPLDYVKGFPAQLVEVFDPLNTWQKIDNPTYDNLKDNWQNLLFHGDNKEVMATLVENGFRAKVDLIYIDPPFMSGADYVRRVKLRGMKSSEKLNIDDASLLQQVIYEDIWKNDAYLQFMYERLILMKELLAETGNICVHLDWHVGHYVKLLMDEIFGKDNFRNEVIWHYRTGNIAEKILARRHDIILAYSKSQNPIFNPIEIKEYYSQIYGPDFKSSFKGRKSDKDEFGEYRINFVDDVWDISAVFTLGSEHLAFQTQKPEALVKRIVKAYTIEPEQALENGMQIPLILDCFIGSGTAARAAQQLGRRWIGCDINKGAVQMTSKTLQQIIHEQIKKGKKTKEDELPRYYSFSVYQVNNYDLQLLRTEAVELAIKHIGIQRLKTDIFFDGTLGKSLAKIIDFNHPLTLLDLQLINDELSKRPNEDRDITIVCMGKELVVDPQIDEWNTKHPVNKIKVIELKTDKKYGNFLIHDPAEAKISVRRINKDKAVVEIQDFISPTIIKRLNIESGIFKAKIPDFRCMIDTVLIDNNYDGKTFRIVYSDVPEKKDDLVKGKYEIELPNPKAKVTVKIIDMLGEEVLVECPLTKVSIS